MTTITFDENSEAGRTLMSMIRNMKPSVRKTIHLTNEKTEVAVQHIPGVPHTQEELFEAVQRSKEDIKAGRVISHEELKKQITTW
ncbi:hypothetical protein M2480_000479 [Parabacteroides sp. PFB2-12]|uniref:hypothetical protein n=1 Tax=unclassified Parabacteroides TaxID=2649774 RepID=UPI002473FEBF|nr:MULTISPECIES: hypothetical protein [unclassified Parabacteroides]MDH6342100.1 hypothetical protein [Parabacteroides sp. PM6-13]MDH6389519.1 hypothetical protein [Parabacteroides sp. PFB2-12]MDL2309892.1 hypothetical protein [Parabacteroides sp. OttesenSCG-928-B22]